MTSTVHLSSSSRSTHLQAKPARRSWDPTSLSLVAISTTLTPRSIANSAAYEPQTNSFRQHSISPMTTAGAISVSSSRSHSSMWVSCSSPLCSVLICAPCSRFSSCLVSPIFSVFTKEVYFPLSNVKRTRLECSSPATFSFLLFFLPYSLFSTYPLISPIILAKYSHIRGLE